MKSILPFICGLSFAFSVSAPAQNYISLTDFLAKASEDERVDFQSDKSYSLKALSYNLPLIEKLEFRTETNNFDFRKQEYLMRVTPNSSKNIKSQRQFQETVRYMSEMELETAYGKAVRERYDLLLNFIFLQDILTVKKKQEVLLKDKVTLFKRSVTLPDFDVLELIEAEDDAQENLREILDLQNAISTFEKEIRRRSGKDLPLRIEKENLLSIADLKLKLKKLQTEKSNSHPELELLSAKMYSQVLEHARELAKSKFSVGYVQAKYGYDPDDSFRKSFSLGVGFEIPLKNAGQLNLNELKIDILEAESDFKSTENQLISEKISVFRTLENLIKKHNLVKEQLDDGQAEFALQEYRKIAEASPKALLKLRENTLKKELLLQKLKFEIIQNYIEYLDLSGLLGKIPMKNYLLKN